MHDVFHLLMLLATVFTFALFGGAGLHLGLVLGARLFGPARVTLAVSSASFTIVRDGAA